MAQKMRKEDISTVKIIEIEKIGDLTLTNDQSNRKLSITEPHDIFSKTLGTVNENSKSLKNIYSQSIINKVIFQNKC